MKTTRHLVSVVVELTAGVKNRHDNFKRRDLLDRVHIHGDTAPVIDNRYGIVGMNRHGNLGAETGHGLIDRVVDDLPDEMM